MRKINLFIVLAIVVALALFIAMVSPVFSERLVVTSTHGITMVWNSTAQQWEEITTPYNTHPVHNASMIIVQK